MAHATYRNVLLAIVFLAMIFFPLANEWLRLVPDIPSSENRALAKKPALNLSHLDPFPVEYERYYNDHFPLRFRWIQWYAQLQFNWFKISPIPGQALIGKEDWFFFAGNEQDAYLGHHRLTAAELDSLRLELGFRSRYLDSLGTKFYFLVAPVKNGIYTEYQPTTAYPLFPDTWGEQLIGHLARSSGVRTINVHDSLRAKRGEGELLYFKRDNHWTPLGAFHAANVALARIHEDFPAVVPNKLEDYAFRKTRKPLGNIAAMLGMGNLGIDTLTAFERKGGFLASVAEKVPYPPIADFPYDWDYESVREIEGRDGPKLLLITDSFGHNIFPYLAEQFGRSVKIFDGWQYKLNREIVLQERPDVVILMPMEANLRHVLSHQARLGE